MTDTIPAELATGSFDLSPPALEVFRDPDRTTSPWAVRIARGPSAGQIVTVHRRRCDAVDWANTHPAPWGELEAIDDVDGGRSPLTTVVTAELVLLRERAARLELDLAAHKALVMDLNDEIKAKYGHGGAMALDRFTARVQAAS